MLGFAPLASRPLASLTAPISVAVSEGVFGLDVVLTRVGFGVAAAEGASGADLGVVTVGFGAQVSEGVSGIDVGSALVGFGARVSEGASGDASGSTLASFSSSVVEGAGGRDTGRRVSVTFAVLVPEGATVRVFRACGRLRWEPVIDTQTANWVDIPGGADAGWTDVDSSQ